MEFAEYPVTAVGVSGLLKTGLILEPIMQMHRYLDLAIVLELRNPFSFFYTKDERRAILVSVFNA